MTTLERIFLKPAPMELDGKPVERKVRKPVGTYLAAAGEEVNLDTYWRRRINDGDVVIVDDVAEHTQESVAALAAAKNAKPKG